MTSFDLRIARFTLALVASGLFLASGCTEGVTRAPVEGVITTGGQPTAGIQVTFEPTEGEPGNVAVGVSDDSGKYRLADPSGESIGAIVGPNRVTLSFYQEVPGDELTELPKNNIPIKLRDGSTILKVPAQGLEDADFTL